ncbi:Cof-type HAD-IIB family hydrolase [Treponema phagedenis]|uniref:Cof-like hydrolase n=1 Tax=Treponema phagedenis TaxID=162 RepID=A0A0B7GVP6_TREPH|nr:Cof-type HAD-IIB family hydrolase [Treponema phagedenis]EFW38843.1 Cof-like hydrolase [Treponema phagedenis F0421]NVP23429.1 Cof-type HAD-IIB family hydrolase [Treponema phagedenis]QEJ95646.1 Cof-type HAD-IIB family hydrolase [Treponema phagedenis]QEJ98570.1 Cof-type HAD-IIB family hydrolase [Treponema phagedenis]QEK01502.1 Cof-type HAD-IIB family hydrolase [Treponema phagedenis]
MKNADIRLVVCDMDGTLLDDKGSITEENKQAIAALKAKNIDFTIATGRMIQMVQEYVRQLDLTSPMICCNGGFVGTIEKPLFTKSFSASVAKQLLEYFTEENLDYVVYTPACLLKAPNSERVQTYYNYNKLAEQGGSTPIPIFEIKELDRHGGFENILKFLICEYNESKLSTVTKYINAIAGVNGELSMPYLLDIMPEGITKGAGIPTLCDYYKIRPDQICAFGDQVNDISMLKAVGLSFCMENGGDLAKEAAMHITSSNKESGVAEAIRKYIL